MVRIARIGAGIGLVILGLFLLVLPGPGILTIAAGLAILAVDYVWARRTLDWMKEKYRDRFSPQERSNVGGSTGVAGEEGNPGTPESSPRP